MPILKSRRLWFDAKLLMTQARAFRAILKQQETEMTDPVVTAVKTDAAATVTKEVSFFESNPKATAIGSFVLGVLLTILVTYFV